MSRRRSLVAEAIRHAPASAVEPVFVPNVPGYSHSNALRFWIRRGGPEGAGIVRTFVEVMRSNPSVASTARTRVKRSRAVETPRSSRPFTDRKSVCFMPRRSARAFIVRTNASSLPATWIANATAASFADPSNIA